MSSVLQTPEVSQLLGQNNVHRNLFPRNWSKQRCAAAKPNWAPEARWWPKPARAPAARRKTNSSFAIPLPTAKSTGARSTCPSRPTFSMRLYERVLEYLAGKELFVQDLYCGADPQYRLPVQFINEYAWHNLFVRQLFIRPDRRRAEKPQARIHHRLRTRLPGRSQARRHQLRSLHHGELHQEDGAHRRHAVCRRDEEVHLRHHEFPAARAQCLPHALLGQHRDRTA